MHGRRGWSWGCDVRGAIRRVVSLSTTQIYTRVSIKRLKEVHAATHPSAKLKGHAVGAGDPGLHEHEPELETMFAALDDEDEEADAGT